MVVLVTITGILLNHTSELSLGKNSVRQPWLLNYYGLRLPSLVSYPVGEFWVSGGRNGHLYLNDHRVAECRGHLIGVVLHRDLLVAGCENELLLLNWAGELVERLDSTYGLPKPLKGLGRCGPDICLDVGDVLLADINQLSWLPYNGVMPHWSVSAPLPKVYQEQLLAGQIATDLSWERVLLDLHSGRIFGFAGVLIVDLAALLLLFLAISGFVLWYQRRV